MMKKVYLRTFGCQMNNHDSGRVKDLLLEDGYHLTDSPEQADILLFNTCSVRRHAEERVFGVLGSLKSLREKNPGVIFGILGCMAEAQKDLIFRKLPHVNFLCGPSDLDRIPEIIQKVTSGAGHLIYVGGHRSKKIPEFSNNRPVTKNAYVKIMEGCSNFCSYCIVPYVRGLERSRFSDEILEEVSQLIDKGVGRITLLGQNVNSYGKGLKEGIGFPELLKKIDRIAVKRVEIDFITAHPMDAGLDLFRAMAELGSISKRLHLPLQSGSNRILKKMNRHYTVEKYKRLIREFRRLIRSSCLSSDLIVGFPGEKDRDFRDTMNAVKEIRFDASYIFKYSPRPFTRAGRFKDDVPAPEKETRHALLLELQKKISEKRKK
jgi:tRNA-2-methylthio-N6-dimethylallyladenosine synthase